MKNKELSWNKIIDDFTASKLSMKDYCVKYGYTYSTFCYHKRQKKQTSTFAGFIEAKEEAFEDTKESVTNKITQSMSRKGNCYDNSLAENFFGIVKSEFYYIEKFKSVDDFINKLKEYLDYYCNDRISLKLKGMTPNEYRKSHLSISQCSS